MISFYGPGIQESIQNEQLVDTDLKLLFESLMPTPQEVYIRLLEFCESKNIDPNEFCNTPLIFPLTFLVKIGHYTPM